MGLGKPSPTDLLPRVPDETLDQLGKDLGYLAAQYDLRPELVLLLAFSILAVHGQPVRIQVTSITTIPPVRSFSVNTWIQ